jgi:hypothetical protein
VDSVSLLANCREPAGIVNWLGTSIHVALTARRELHSGLLARLKEAQRSRPKG